MHQNDPELVKVLLNFEFRRYNL